LPTGYIDEVDPITEVTVTINVEGEVINIDTIPDVVAPVTGATPVEEFTTAQYTGEVTWAPVVVATFETDNNYTATIKL
jgi:hypothetical protein